MKLPHDTVKACAEALLPGCHYVHGESDFGNIKLDGTMAGQRVVYLDDKMPLRFVTTKYGQITGATYSCLLMLLVPTKLGDTPDHRQPIVEEMVNASAHMLAALGKDSRVKEVKMLRPADIVFNEFDLNADGVALYLDITMNGALNPCPPPSHSEE